MSTTAAIISTITRASSAYYEPLNEAVQDKVDELAASMTSQGWRGSPIVVSGDRAVTGSHRLAARELVGMDTVPVVEVEDLCNAFDLSWDEILRDRDDDWWGAIIEVGFLLPAEVAEYLGYDAC